MSLVPLSFSADTVHSFGMCIKEATPLELDPSHGIDLPVQWPGPRNHNGAPGEKDRIGLGHTGKACDTWDTINWLPGIAFGS